MRAATLDSLTHRLSRVLALVADHIDEPLPLDRLAAEAALSPFHFHRLWRAATGESVAETIRRLRIERAAAALATGRAPVTEIALQAGFASSQAFARAFRAAAGQSPSEYRRASGRLTPSVPATSQDRPLAIRIESIEPFAIVAARHEGAHEEGRLALKFRAVSTWGQQNALTLAGIYGVPLDDARETPHARYRAGIDFGACQPSAPFERVALGGGDHAVLRVNGSWEQLPAAWDALYGWLLGSGREPGEGPGYQHFLDTPATPEPERRTDLYLPLAS